MDVAEPPGDFPRPSRVPRTQTRLRSVRAGQGLPVVRHRPHRPAGRCAAGQGPRDRAPTGAGRAVDPAQMSTSTRWTVAVMVVVVALGVALWTQLGDRGSPNGSIGSGQARDRRDADTAEALAGPRARADLPPCPAAGTGPGPGQLRGITLECAGDGTTMEVAKAIA